MNNLFIMLLNRLIKTIRFTKSKLENVDLPKFNYKLGGDDWC